jgi:alanyl-tRNA synthetase
MLEKQNQTNRQLLYLLDPKRLDFEANIQQIIPLTEITFGIILDQTYFYPTGGGQENDTGWIAEARVLNVYKQTNELTTVIHVVDRELPLGRVQAKIDAERRLRHMQHHTAQHLLTQCFIRLLNTETVSANINGYTPSTLDLYSQEITKTDLEHVENLANTIIYENRDVKTYFVPPEQIYTIPLRKAPSVKGNIRIVEIDGYDYSACGGTHVLKTGSIGIIKIVKTERVNEKLRVHFIAGWQAVETLRSYFEISANLAAQLSTTASELPQAIQHITEQLKETQKELQSLRLDKIEWEASDLVQKSQLAGKNRFVQVISETRPVQELRLLADRLRQHSDLVAILIKNTDQKISIVVTCSDDAGISAQDLLQQLILPISGRGGGDDCLAQGGGNATASQISAILDIVRSILANQG